MILMILKWVVISSYAEHARKLVTRWLSMRENWLLFDWYAHKLVTSKLYTWENNFCAQRAFSEFFLSSSCHPFLCPLLPSLSNFLCPLFFCSLSPSLGPLSYVSVPCLLSYVPCLMALLLVFRPLSPLSRLCSLSPDLCTLSINCPSVPFFVALFHWSCLLLLCFSSSVPPSLVL